MKIYIYTTILIAICFAVYILIDRKYKNSRPDTKTKIQRNISNRIIGNLLQSDPSGNLSVIPAPLVDQSNYVLTGNSNWAPPSTLTYINARIDGISKSNIEFTILSTSPTCPAPFVLTNPTTFTSPNIPGNYKIDILINNFAAFAVGYCYIKPVIGGVDSSATIIGKQVPNVPCSLSGVFILSIPAKTTLTFNLTNVSSFYSSGGTITIIRM